LLIEPFFSGVVSRGMFLYSIMIIIDSNVIEYLHGDSSNVGSQSDSDQSSSESDTD